MANHPTPTSLDKESTKQKNKASKKADENLQIKIEWPDQLSMKRKGNYKSALTAEERSTHLTFGEIQISPKEEMEV